ncbi:nicotinate-nucleotide--dimethylbenzimidazole phosphoribosyltransferase [Streptomyces sp. NPDC059720]|uniref:nicotinate-nucleotide--dimethylbenzimidazole phosphoribosyltransferase n=1 Tax=Streptomyces sp. NPDC059720 TaxID=3346924 RepID=UPI0036C289BA
MTDTGQVPGEGLPESAGMVEQPGASAHGSYTYLSDDSAEDEDLLLPGAQGAWGNEVPPPAPEPVAETVHQPGPHELSGRDSGSVDLSGVRLPDPPPIPPITPRRPLHLGPPLPDSSASPVRSLADRGPADAPVRQPAAQTPGPEYVDAPRAAEAPAGPPWGAQAAAQVPVAAGAAPAETVVPEAAVPVVAPAGTAQAVATHSAPQPAEAAQAAQPAQPAQPVQTAQPAQTAAAEQPAAVPVAGGPEGLALAGQQGPSLPEQAAAVDPAGAGTAQVAAHVSAAVGAAAAPAEDPAAGAAAPAEAGQAPGPVDAAAEAIGPDAAPVAAGDAVAGAAEAAVDQAHAAGPAVSEAGTASGEAAVAGPAHAEAAPGAGRTGAVATEPEAAPGDAGVAPDGLAATSAEAGALEGLAAARAAAVDVTGPAAEGVTGGAGAVQPGAVAAAAEPGDQAVVPADQGPATAHATPAEAQQDLAGADQAKTTAEQPATAAEQALPGVAEVLGAPEAPAAAEAPEAATPVPAPAVPAPGTPTPVPAVATPAPEAVTAPAAPTLPDPAATPANAATPATAPAPETTPVLDAAQAPEAAPTPAPAPEPVPFPEAAAPLVPEPAVVHPPETAAEGSAGVSPGAPGAPAPTAEDAALPAAAAGTPVAPEARADAEAAVPAPRTTAPQPVAPEAAAPAAAAPQAPGHAAAAPDPASAAGAPEAGRAQPEVPAEALAPVQPSAAGTAAPEPGAAPAPADAEPAPEPAGPTASATAHVTVVVPARAPEAGGTQPVQGPQQSQAAQPGTPEAGVAVPAPREGDADAGLAQSADDLDTRAADQEDLDDLEIRREESAAAVAQARPSTGPAAPGYDPAEREAVLKVMRERRDIRNGFRSDPIPHEVLLRVLEAAHHAPSVGHSQPWDFVVIRSADTRRAMHELAMRQRDAYAKSLPKGRAKQFKELKIEAILDTPVNIVVTADPTRGGRHTLGRHTQPQMAPYSAALAVENLWLAARAEGLGVGWVSFFDEREMVRALGLPEHLEVIAYLCVGYVDEFPDEPELLQAGWSKRRPLSWVVHEETYGRRALPGEEPHDLLAETVAQIRPLDAKALGEAWERQKRMTKPAGALGMLEIISAQLSGLSRQCPPPIPEPAAVAIFAGDHGVHAQGVTPWPQEVTAQMVANFLGGGAVCNAFATQVGAEVCIVDVGVAADLPATPGLLPRKIRGGTSDMTTGPAMSREEARQGIEVGIETARDLVAAGNKALLTGEMGIGNTTASAALISVFTGADPAEVTGRGTGINDETLARKTEVVRRALELHQPDPADPIGALAAIGGFEHAALVGLLLGGASLRTPVILDGVSAGAAALVARAIAPEVLAACIAGHRSAEPGHVAALNKLGLRPLVDLDLRLGEGTGALLALPLVQSTARAMHEVATFDSAGVTEK